VLATSLGRPVSPCHLQLSQPHTSPPLPPAALSALTHFTRKTEPGAAIPLPAGGETPPGPAALPPAASGTAALEPRAAPSAAVAWSARSGAGAYWLARKKKHVHWPSGWRGQLLLPGSEKARSRSTLRGARSGVVG